MSRRSGFSGLITQMARAAAQREREQQKYERNLRLSAERDRKQEIKLKAQTDKEEKQRYLEERIHETEDLNKDLGNRIADLSSILEHTLTINDTILFDTLRIHDEFRKFELPPELQKEHLPTSREEYFSKIPKPSAFDKLIPGWDGRYQSKLQEAEKHFKEYQEKFDKFATEQNNKIETLREVYNREKQSFDAKIQQRNQEVDQLESAYKSNDPEAIIAYCSMVLEHSDYPDDFPQEFRIAYVPESKELIIEYELPGKDVIPTSSEYKYVKAKDVIEEKPRKPSFITIPMPIK